MDMVTKNTFALTLADAERTNWNTAKSISLYTNEVIPNPNMSAGNFTPADYDGFTKLGITLGPTFVAANGKLTFLQSAQFNSLTGPGTTNIVKGVLVETAAGNPLAAGNLPDPVPMGLTGQALIVVLENQDGVMSITQLPI